MGRRLLLNPIDVFRLINLSALGAGAGAGNDLLMGMTASHAYAPVMLYGVLLWCGVTPFALARMLFRRKEV